MKALLGIVLLSALAVSLLTAGCSSNHSGSKSGERSTEISASDKPKTSITPAESTSRNRKAPAPSFAAEPLRTATPLDDVPLTGPAFHVSGRITFTDGRPATSATVELSESRLPMEYQSQSTILATASTDQDGRYSIHGDGPIKYHTLTITGYLPVTALSLTGAQANRNRGGLHKITRDIVLPEYNEVKGRLINEKGEAMPGLVVLMAPVPPARNQQVNPPVSNQHTSPKLRVTTSTATGEFTFPYIQGGKWAIGASAPDYAAVARRIEVPTTEPLTLTFSSGGGTVIGSVHLKLDGSPVPAMPVKLSALGEMADMLYSKNTNTASDGSFRFDHVSSASLFIAIPAEVMEEKKLGLADPRPDIIALPDKETTNVQVMLYPGYTITGFIFDKDTSESLSGAVVKISDGDYSRSSPSGPDGAYRLENFFPGNKTAKATVVLKGYSISNSNDPHFNPGQSTRLVFGEDFTVIKDFPMVHQVTISGKVVTNEEMPAGGALVSLVTADDNMTFEEQETTANADGTFKLYARPFSNVAVEAQASGYARSFSEYLDITTEDVKEVKVVLFPGAIVQGKVIDPDGQPVEGATVHHASLYSFPSTTLSIYETVETTGKDGTFAISNASAKIELHAQKPPFVSSERQQLELKPGETRVGVQTALRTAHFIAGKVSFRSGKPAPKCFITAEGFESQGSAVTNEDGLFRLEGLVEEMYSVTAKGSGSSPRVEGVKVGSDNLELIVDEAPERTRGTVTLEGTVVDDISGLPLEDFEAPGGEKLRDQTGKFEVASLFQNTTYGFSISASGYEEQAFSVPVPANTTRFTHTFRMGKGGIIKGRVVERATAKPLANVLVVNWGIAEAYNPNSSTPKGHTTTDDDGNFVLAPAPIGTNSIQFRPAPPLIESNKEATVKNAETADMGTIELSAGAIVKGRVIRSANRNPLPSREVSLYLSQQGVKNALQKEVKTDENGIFVFTGIPAGQVALSCGSSSFKFQIAVEEVKEQDFILGSVMMSGTLTSNGTPASGWISSQSKDMPVSTYARNGKYIITDITPGKHEFRIGSNSLTATVEVPDQSEFQYDFTVPDGSL